MANLDDKALEEEEVVVSEELAEETEADEIVVEEKPQSISKQKEKKGLFGKLFSIIKGAFGELKKSTYPTFGKVVKGTLTVLAVTAVFLVVIFAIDQLLFFLTGLLPQ